MIEKNIKVLRCVKCFHENCYLGKMPALPLIHYCNYCNHVAMVTRTLCVGCGTRRRLIKMSGMQICPALITFSMSNFS